MGDNVITLATLANQPQGEIACSVCGYVYPSYPSYPCPVCAKRGQRVDEVEAELARLRAELADERRAVERLATMIDLRGTCPPGRYGSPDCAEESGGNCRACWAAWARSEEVK